MKSHHESLEQKVEKHYRAKERRKRKRMKVSGKSVFTLQRLMESRPRIRPRIKRKSKR